VRAIIRARYPALRTVEALAATVPLFLLLFASAYFTMARTNPASFSTHSLTRTDALYFTVTAFSTVGFGDITAVSQPASQARGHRAVAARPGAQGGDLARPLAPNHTQRSHLPAIAHRRPGRYHDQQCRQRARQRGRNVAAGSNGQGAGEQINLG
jgi:hypothetical protein